jgi:hypothetical protein
MWWGTLTIAILISALWHRDYERQRGPKEQPKYTPRRAKLRSLLENRRELQRALISRGLLKIVGCGSRQGADNPALFKHPTGPHLAAFSLPSVGRVHASWRGSLVLGGIGAPCRAPS